MDAATAVHYSQPLQPPTATADERVTRPLSSAATAATANNKDIIRRRQRQQRHNNKEAAIAPDNVPLVDARYSPRYGGMIANRKVATLAKKQRPW
jgi:hypothetical protein